MRTALQLYKNHKLSFGKAAELVAISREEFFIELETELQRTFLLNSSGIGIALI